MSDIKDREDIVLLINAFYTKVRSDKVIGYFFNDVVNVNWEAHLPKMYEFWSKVLFSKGDYNGNPMAIHQGIHAQSPLTIDHFDHWVELFQQTVDVLFEGENAEIVKYRAATIASIMKVKVIH
jgi:hemoglobin